MGSALAMSAGGLCHSVRRAQWTDVPAALTGLNGLLQALALTTTMDTTFAKAARWRSLLTPDRVPPEVSSWPSG
jgi:hypothetical protein